MRIGRIMWGLGILLIASVGAFAQQVSTDYDHAATFANYKTYSWAKVEIANPLWVTRVQSAIDGQLAAKGWKKVETGGDAAVVAIGTTQQKQQLNSYYSGGGWRFGGGMETTNATTYTVGTLVVDIFDAKTKGLIWRGTAGDTLSTKSDKDEKIVNKAVDKMFDKFPPGADTKK